MGIGSLVGRFGFEGVGKVFGRSLVRWSVLGLKMRNRNVRFLHVAF